MRIPCMWGPGNKRPNFSAYFLVIGLAGRDPESRSRRSDQHFRCLRTGTPITRAFGPTRRARRAATIGDTVSGISHSGGTSANARHQLGRREAAEAAGDPIRTLPVLYHLLWRGELACSHTEPLSDRTVIHRAEVTGLTRGEGVLT
jgi:hypothetical protein